MSQVQIESKDQIMQRLKRENPDWNDQKLKMQSGRIFAQKEKDAAVERKHKEIESQVKRDHPDLEGKALEKEINARIQAEKEQVELVELSNTVKTTRDAYETAVFDYATAKNKIDGKSSKTSLPKEVHDALEKIKKYDL